MGLGIARGLELWDKLSARKGALLTGWLLLFVLWAIVVGTIGPNLLQSYSLQSQELKLENIQLRQALTLEHEGRSQLQSIQLEAAETLAKAQRDFKYLEIERQLLKKDQSELAKQAVLLQTLQQQVKEEKEKQEKEGAELAKLDKAARKLVKAEKLKLQEMEKERLRLEQEGEEIRRRQELEVSRQSGEQGQMILEAPQKANKPRIMLAMAVQPQPCETGNVGEATFLKSLKNKVDYARAQGLSLWFCRELLSEDYFLYWNKLRLIRSLMDNPQIWDNHDWFMWVDYDILITDFDFVPPVDSYPAEASIVIWGDKNKFYNERPDLQYGLNLGLIMFRKADATKAFLDEWLAIGKASEGEKHLEAANRIVVNNFSGNKFCDQKALLYLLNVLRPDLRHHVHLLSDDETSYTINGWYQHEVWKIMKWLREGRKPGGSERSQRWPFVVHYAGCQFCSLTYAPVGVGPAHFLKCLQSWDRMYNFVDNLALGQLGFRHQNFTADPVETGTIDELLPLDEATINHLMCGNDTRWSLPCLGDQCKEDGWGWSS